jgi:hypothetical protein
MKKEEKKKQNTNDYYCPFKARLTSHQKLVDDHIQKYDKPDIPNNTLEQSI